MKKFFWLSLWLILPLWALRAQSTGEYLMIIGNDTVSPSEFEYMYTKNLDLVRDPQQKDIDYYKGLFIRYKLELADARASHLDRDWNFKSEYGRYRRELAKKYMVDEKTIDRLVREAYQRMQTDVKVAHIMVRLPRNSLPSDTLAAWKKIRRYRRRLMHGAKFEDLALASASEGDPSARDNKGHLGWINVFQTVYPFETAAYRTPKGQISEPFRTKYGYHILWVEDRRPAVYRVQVRQLVLLKSNHPEETYQKIQQIYAQLKKDPSQFETLARKYSEDKRTAKLGGLLAPFGIREKIPVFENHAFALKNPGDISEPFESRRAWHILQLVKKISIPPFDKIKAELKQKVMSDDRAKLARKNILEKARRLFPVEEKGSYTQVMKYLDKDFFVGKWRLPQGWTKLDRNLFVINNDQRVQVRDFLRWLYRHQVNNPKAYAKRKELIGKLYNDFKDETLLRYYENHLEKIYPDFARTSREYYDGLLLFKYKSQKIWEKAINDTLGLQQYYNAHLDHYRQPTRYRVLALQTTDKKLARKVYRALKKGAAIADINKLVGKKAVVDVRIIDEKNMDKNLLQKHIVRSKDREGKYHVRGILKKIPSYVPPLDEIRGKVLSDYQTQLERNLLNELEKKYPVKINDKVWQQLRAKYKH